MADVRITDLAQATTLEADDVFVVVDVHDKNMAPTGTDKQITLANLAAALSTTIVVAGTTPTNLTGLLKGNGSTITAAVPSTDYVTPAELTSSLTSALGSYVASTALTSALSSYVTSSTLATALSGYVTNTELTTAISTALSSYVTSSALTTTLSTYATQTWVNGAIATAISGITGGSGTPGGSNGQVQFNNSGAFGGAAGLNYNATELAVQEGTTLTSAITVGYCSHAEGNGNAGAWQNGEHAEGTALNGLRACRSHLTLQFDPNVSTPAPFNTPYAPFLVNIGELRIGGANGERIQIPPGWTYSFEFNITVVDTAFNVSTIFGKGVVQNTGAAVQGVGNIITTNNSGSFQTTSWWKDGIGDCPAGELFMTNGLPANEVDGVVFFDTDSSTGEIVIRVLRHQGLPTNPCNWFAIFTINKIHQAPVAGSIGGVAPQLLGYLFTGLHLTGSSDPPSDALFIGPPGGPFTTDSGWTLSYNPSINKWEMVTAAVVSGDELVGVFFGGTNNTLSPVGSYTSVTSLYDNTCNPAIVAQYE